MTARTLNDLLVEAIDLAAMAVAADPEATPTITHNALEKLRPILAAAGMDARQVEARCDDFVRAVAERVGQLSTGGSGELH